MATKPPEPKKQEPAPKAVEPKAKPPADPFRPVGTCAGAGCVLSVEENTSLSGWMAAHPGPRGQVGRLFTQADLDAGQFAPWLESVHEETTR